MIRVLGAAALVAAMLLTLATEVALGLQQATRREEETLRRLIEFPTERFLRAHTEFLSSDLLEGRAAGTRGGETAARYVAAQFAALGLEPAAGDGGYLRPIEMVGLEPQPSLVVAARRRTTAFTHLQDYVAWPERPESSLTVDGDLVFVGFGIHAPEWNWDDFKGIPQTGNILILLPNDPGTVDSTLFNGSAMTYYGRWTYKLEQAARQGAVGVILVHDETTEPWAVIQSTWSGERLLAARSPTTSLRFVAWMTTDAVRRLVATAGVDFDVLARRARLADFSPIALGAHAAVHIRSRLRPVQGFNVVARVTGSDPQSRNDAVLFTAHYDHLGMRNPIDGDSIYNGAVDNASGVAALLATAAAFAHVPSPTRRSVLFLATTGSEPSLLGARDYLAHPVIGAERTVAVLNVDGANLDGPANDVVALGAAESTLDSVVTRAAAAEGVRVAEDPWPAGGRFFDSDHFPFARAGIPALQIVAGTEYRGRPPEWGVQRLREFLDRRFHRPSDEWRDDFDFGGALQQVRLLIRIGWDLGRVDRFPTWHMGSPFRPAGEQLRIRRERFASP